MITVVAVVYTSDSAVTSWSYILEQTSDRDTLRGVKLKEDVRQADKHTAALQTWVTYRT